MKKSSSAPVLMTSQGCLPMRMLRLRRLLRRSPRRFLIGVGVAFLVAFAVASFTLFRFVVRAGGMHPTESRDSTLEEVRLARNVWREVMTGSAEAGGAEKARDGLWEDVMDDVAIVIKTGLETHGERLRLLREKGWMSVGRKVPNLLVIGDQFAPGVVGMRKYGKELLLDAQWHDAHKQSNGLHKNISGVSVDEDALVRRRRVGVEAQGDRLRHRPSGWFSKSGWRGDKDKNLPAFHLLRTLYPGKKWYVMLDDDTYMFLDNFAEWVRRHERTYPDSMPTYTGKVFYVAHCGIWARNGSNLEHKGGPRAGFAHGGSGIVLNAAAMNKMYPDVTKCMRDHSKCWAGDMQVGLCLRERGVSVMRYDHNKRFERHFTPFSASHAMGDARYTSRWRSRGRPITFHKVAADEVALLSDFEKAMKRQGEAVLYRPLLSFLIERGLMPTWGEPRAHETHVFEKDHEDFEGV